MRSDKYVEVEKVRAHSGVRGNEIVDSLAVDATRSDADLCDNAACGGDACKPLLPVICVFLDNI
ncbi:hypothetical protein OZ109_002587 [Vibrio cholerae]|nr:hypothetical protein [Vibrio cholerae]ELE0370287.1 hypothetical protein [Vibrio cholerae]